MKGLINRIGLSFSFLFLKGGDSMLVTVYITLIIAGRRTLKTTPITLRSQVEEELNVLGLDGEGNPVKENN